MAQTLIELVLAPLLVAASALAARRWGQRVGGVVSAFPAIVGPVLLITALTHGAAFTARVADGTLLGLVSLGVFTATYGRAAARAGWAASLACAWGAASLVAAAVASLGAALVAPTGLGLAAGALLLAYRSLPPVPASPVVVAQAQTRALGLPARMAATALLVTVLAAAARALGPLLGGILAALPVLASALAVFTHRQHGGVAVIELLRGMLAGMTGFVAFCELIALTISDGLAAAFVSATVLALVVQLLTARWFRREGHRIPGPPDDAVAA